MQTTNTASSPQPHRHRNQQWQQPTIRPLQKSKEFAMITSNFGLVQAEHLSLSLSETISRIGKQQYFITPQLLVGTTVSEFKRAVLRFWIYEEGAKLEIDRNTIATANFFIDLFLEKGGEVVIEDLQILAIAALILANKSVSNVERISFNERIFPRRLLNEFQMKICKRVHFRLNPVTYVQVLDELIYAWNIFAERHSDLWGYQNGGKQEKNQRSFSCPSIYQLLDTIFLVVKSFAFNLFELVLQVFRVFLLKDYQTISSRPKSIEDQVIISFWHNPEDQPLMESSFDSIFRHFLNFIESCNSKSQPMSMSLELSQNQEIQAFVLSFLKAGFESTIQREALPSKEPHLQTFNPMSLQVARNFIYLKKNHRKSSGETLAI